MGEKTTLLTISTNKAEFQNHRSEFVQRALTALDHTFALQFLASQFTSTANCFSLLARTLYRWFFEEITQFHFTKHAFALQFLFQSAERLVYIVVTNEYLHVVSVSCFRFWQLSQFCAFPNQTVPLFE